MYESRYESVRECSRKMYDTFISKSVHVAFNRPVCRAPRATTSVIIGSTPTSHESTSHIIHGNATPKPRLHTHRRHNGDPQIGPLPRRENYPYSFSRRAIPRRLWSRISDSYRFLVRDNTLRILEERLFILHCSEVWNYEESEGFVGTASREKNWNIIFWSTL